jgi:hypothetical protein
MRKIVARECADVEELSDRYGYRCAPLQPDDVVGDGDPNWTARGNVGIEKYVCHDDRSLRPRERQLDRGWIKAMSEQEVRWVWSVAPDAEGNPTQFNVTERESERSQGVRSNVQVRGEI